MENTEQPPVHPSQAQFDPRLSEIKFIVWSQDLEVEDRGIVDMNTRQGRSVIAIRARQAMLDGHFFETFSLKHPAEANLYGVSRTEDIIRDVMTVAAAATPEGESTKE